jgi:hypothetical protein
VRDWINLLESANFLVEDSRGFILDPALPPENYIMTNSLREVERWKAKCLVGNNGDEHLGEMTDVGYIMISKTSNHIIPVSRDDEHNMGRDLLYDLQDGTYAHSGPGKRAPKLKINPDDYIPVWSMGNNYIYDEKQIPGFLNVVRKFLSYGGRDGPLKGGNNLSGVQLMLSDFVEREGNVTVEPGSLAPVGKRIVDAFTGLSQTLVALGQEPDRIQARKAFVGAAAVAKFIIPMSFDLRIENSFCKALPSKLRELQKENDIQGLSEIIFGFHGLKNLIHIELKKIVEDAAKGDSMAQFYLRRDVQGIWGDAELAIDMLGRL